MLRVDFLGSSAGLACDHPDALDWARSWLPPYMTVAEVPEGTPVDHRIEAHYDGVPGSGGREGAPEVLFLGRSGVSWAVPGGRLIRDLADGSQYAVTPDSVTVRYATADPYSLRDPARLVREVLVARACSAGAARLHAGAVAHRDGAVLVLGGAGAGKSSTVAQLLSAGAGFVANDRVLLRVSERRARVHGVPLAIRWSPAQLRVFPAGAELMRDYDTVSSLRRRDSRAGHAKYELTPAELEGLTGRPAVADAPLGSVVVVDRSGPTGSARVTAISPVTGLTALREAWLGTDPAFPPFFLTGPLRHAMEHPVLAAQDTLAGLPWCRLTASHDDAGAVPALLDHLGLTPTPQESH